jgi:phage-related baseplate assembly protein
MGDYIKFVNDDPNAVLQQCIGDYETIAGRTLGNADPEMLLITAFAYRMANTLKTINITANQNLIGYAGGAALDELAELMGVYRLDAGAAMVTLTFSLVAGAPALTIPAGTRVKTNDGAVMFATNVDTPIAAGTVSVGIDATCLTAGVVGNGYGAGSICTIVDPQAYVTGVTNTEASVGGSDEESDDALRVRVPLAGPTEAYQFFAKTASAAIVDVGVVTTSPGTVTLYPVLQGGNLPDAGILAAAVAICSDKKVRPLNDTVLADTPTVYAYTLDVRLTIMGSYNRVDIVSQVTANLQAFTATYKLGQNLILNQIVDRCVSVPGVFNVAIPSVPGDYATPANVFTKCTSITVNVVATV